MRLNRCLAQAFALATLPALAACSVDPSVPALPTEAMTVEVVPLGIDGRPDTYSSERSVAVAASLAGSPDDVLCLTGASRTPFRTSIATALEAEFPFSVDLPTTASTHVDDPRDASGKLPEPHSDAPCTPEQRTTYLQLLSCLGVTCRAFYLDYMGKILFGDCYTNTNYPCGAAIAAIPGAGPDDRCRACFLTMARSGAYLKEMVDPCVEDPGDPLGFEGDSGVLLLSKWPVLRADITVLPSSALRRAFVQITVKSPGGRSVDVACGSLGPTAELGLPSDASISDPYPGLYGDWTKEHDLQTVRLLEFLDTHQWSDHGVVLGAFGDSPSRIENGETFLSGSGEASIAKIEGPFALAVPDAFTPNCTLCPENPALPYRPAPAWPNRIYLRRGSGSSSAAIRTHLGATVPVGPQVAPAIDAVPIAPAYGFRSTIDLK